MAEKFALHLSTNPESFLLFQKRRADTAFGAVRDKVWQRDTYTCQFCGFQAQQYQEVINLDDNYRNNKFSNMVTACCFCAQCFFIENVGQGGFGGGKLIYLPELSQAELNSFCHVIFCALANGAGYSDVAQSVYRDLKFRAQPIEEKFGEGMSRPHVFGQMIAECGKDQDVLKNALRQFRLLPTYAKFKKQLETWAASAAQELG
ncbi:MAG: type IVB secretion system protein IcmJDotN [Gammaproteobacteria bacterium]|jgi:intracellular multiplication protein IcmJ